MRQPQPLQAQRCSHGGAPLISKVGIINISNLTGTANAQVFARTLLAGGFVLVDVKRKPTYMSFLCFRYDEFGAKIFYIFVLSDVDISVRSIAQLRHFAKSKLAQVVVIGDAATTDIPVLEWKSFLAKCGGPIRSWLPLDPDFSSQLTSLGRNVLPPNLVGSANDLFEEYVHVGLQFLLGDRVIRYGQARSGEALPDGAAILRSGSVVFLYDAKAYKDGYPVTRDSIRQFADYVREFNECYGSYASRVHSFLVISGGFSDRDDVLQGRSAEMYAESGAPLVFIRAEGLADAVKYTAQQPTTRSALDWKAILSSPIFRSGQVKSAISKAKKDQIVRTKD